MGAADIAAGLKKIRKGFIMYFIPFFIFMLLVLVAGKDTELFRKKTIFPDRKGKSFDHIS